VKHYAGPPQFEPEPRICGDCCVMSPPVLAVSTKPEASEVTTNHVGLVGAATHHPLGMLLHLSLHTYNTLM